MSETKADRDSPSRFTQWTERVSALSFGPVASLVGTLAIFAAAWASRALLDPMLPQGFPYLTFFPAVILSSFLFGLRAGILSAVLCGAVAWYYFIPPFRSFTLQGAEVALGLYVFVVATDLALIHGMRIANRRLREERRVSLELAAAREIAARQLSERAAELRKANDALRESEVKTHLATQTAGIGLWQWHIPSGRVFWDDTMFALYGLAPTQDGTVAVSDYLARLHPDDHPDGEQVSQAEAVRDRAFTREFRILRGDDGRVRHLRAVEISRVDAAGRAEWVVGTNLDITDEKERESHIRILLGEVNHRAKNLLGVVLSVARRTAGPGQPEFMANFAARIRSLAAGQDLLVENKWRGVRLHALVRAQLGPHNDLIGDRISVSGDDLLLSSSAVQTLGMAFHELVTNAVKHGALSVDGGKIALGWEQVADAGARRFSLCWEESGGPPLTGPPERKGFGSVVTGDMVRMTLDAEVESEFAPGGFRWRLACSLENVMEAAGS